MPKKKPKAFHSEESVEHQASEPESERQDSDISVAGEAEATSPAVDQAASEPQNIDMSVASEEEPISPALDEAPVEEPIVDTLADDALDKAEDELVVLELAVDEAPEDKEPDGEETEPVEEDSHLPIRIRKRRRKKPSKRTRALLMVAVVLWVGALAVIGVRQFMMDFSKPLGEPLGTFSTSGRSPGGSEGLADQVPSPVDNIDPVTGQPVTSDGRSPLCGGPAEMTVMLVGVDTGYDPSVRGLADTIRVVHLDFVRPGISVLSVPRALWVEAPMLSDYANEMRRYFGTARDADGNLLEEEGPYGMLNSTYFYGNKHQVPGGGPTVLAEALYVNLGVPVDHYAAINMTTIADAIDAIGGVDVDVPYAITGWDAGLQHMSGAQVVTYARQRRDDSDWYRVERQNIVLEALWEKMSQPRNLVKVPNLTDRFIGEVLTDLSKAQIVSMACLIAQIGPDEVDYYPITPQMVTVSDTTVGFYILLPKPEAIDPLVQEFFTGS